MLNAPILLERDHASLTIAWEANENAQHYELEMLATDHSEHHGDAKHAPAWVVLSSTIKSTSIRKKNLVPSVGK